MRSQIFSITLAAHSCSSNQSKEVRKIETLRIWHHCIVPEVLQPISSNLNSCMQPELWTKIMNACSIIALFPGGFFGGGKQHHCLCMHAVPTQTVICAHFHIICLHLNAYESSSSASCYSITTVRIRDQE